MEEVDDDSDFEDAKRNFEREKKKKAQKDLLVQLKKSIVQSGSRQFIGVVDSLDAGSTEGRYAKLVKLHNQKKELQSFDNEINYAMGQLLNSLPIKSPEFSSHIIKLIGKGYSKSHCYYLVSFYKFCSKYKTLIYSNLSSNLIKSKFKLIQECITSDRDVQFWESY